jgi:hypothetical protein
VAENSAISFRRAYENKNPLFNVKYPKMEAKLSRRSLDFALTVMRLF